MTQIRISLNRHWYSRFWIKQFYQVWRNGEVSLRPLLRKQSPPACFYFEYNGKPCLIDITDSKELAHDPKEYFLYFKANFGTITAYPKNVLPGINGTTLTRHNTLVPFDSAREYDLVWLTGISGGRLHKIALFEALASLPLKMKLAAKMVGAEDRQRWGDHLTRLGVEVWKENAPYSTWLDLNKKSRWCLLSRGKHDCLSFKMVDYASIGAAVVTDYPPTSQWATPLVENRHYISFGVSGSMENEMAPQDFDALRKEYKIKVQALLPQLLNDGLRKQVAMEGHDYFLKNIANGEAARAIIRQCESFTANDELVRL